MEKAEASFKWMALFLFYKDLLEHLLGSSLENRKNPGLLYPDNTLMNCWEKFVGESSRSMSYFLKGNSSSEELYFIPLFYVMTRNVYGGEIHANPSGCIKFKRRGSACDENFAYAAA